MEMSRARRSSVLAALLFTAGCTAHEPPPRVHVPDDPAPQLAEWRGPVVAAPSGDAADAADAETPVTVTASPTGREADGAEPAVKVAESPEADAYERGKRDARVAIARGRLGLETFGYPASCRGHYARILREQYDVGLYEVAGCVVNGSILGHARGYNEVMTAEIERRHGADALDRAARKAGCR